jgi:hypothetical protein
MKNRHAYSRRQWRIAGALAPVVAVIVVGGMSPAAEASEPSTSSIQWMLYSGTVGQINALDTPTSTPVPSATAVTRSAFDSSNAIVDVTGSLGWNPTEQFYSFSAYSVPNKNDPEYPGAVQALAGCNGSNIPYPAGSYIMYDNENIDSGKNETPAGEQADPLMYETAFVKLVHKCNYKAILAPAVDLVDVDTNAQQASCYQSGLGKLPNPTPANENDIITYAMNYFGPGQCNLASDVGEAEPDAYLIQAEDFTALDESSCEADDGGVNYCGFVNKAAADAQAADPSSTPIDVFAEVDSTGTEPGKVSYTATGNELYDDVVNTYDVNTYGQVNGYMIITPGGHNPTAPYDLLTDLGYCITSTYCPSG